jgi:CubicO group peptidase (beta-lactamase class C family)
MIAKFDTRCALRLAVTASVALAALAPAMAQVPVGKDPVNSILVWTPKQQLERYPALEKSYKTNTIRKGTKVLELPKADKQIDPKVKIGAKSMSLDDVMKANRITGLIAVKDGKIVLEKYALGRKPEDRWTTFSVAKSVTSTLIGAAVKDRYVGSIYDQVVYYVPELKGTAYDGVSIRQLMMMSSGVKWNETYTDPKSDVALSGSLPYDGVNNPIVQYMAKLKREAPPGTKWVYKTGETDLAGFVLSRALAGKSLSQYASEKIWAPVGMEQDAVWMVDKAGLERGGCCISATLRDYARIGLFMLGGGKAGDTQVAPDGWVEEATANHAPPIPKPKKGEMQPSYGYFWWPQEAPNYGARGIFGQGMNVYPEDNLVIVMNSAMLKATGRDQQQVMSAVMKAIHDAAVGG